MVFYHSNREVTNISVLGTSWESLFLQEEVETMHGKAGHPAVVRAFCAINARGWESCHAGDGGVRDV